MIIKFRIAQFVKQVYSIKIKGCGSGFIIGNIALNQKDYFKNHYLAIDINFDACYLTKKVSDYYNLTIDTVNADGLSGLKYYSTKSIRLMNSIDVLIFNPPYVPTEKEELERA